MTTTIGLLMSENTKPTPYLRELMNLGKTMGILVKPFTASSLPSLSCWPDVVYNRIATRKEENSLAVIRLKRQWQREGIPYFNERFFNKKEIDQLLQAKHDVKHVLPASLPMRQEASTLQTFLAQHEAIYLKPIAGSMGEGICRIQQMDRQYLLQFREGSMTRSVRYASLQKALATARSKMRSMPYLIQASIELKRYQEAKTDFRVHLCKNENMAWEVVAIAAKLAAKSGITTHVHSGGHVENARRVLTSWYGKRAHDVREHVEYTAKQITNAIEHHFYGELGEIGLDMGIDVRDHIYLFEANAKPGRMIFAHPTLREASNYGQKCIIHYACALAKASS